MKLNLKALAAALTAQAQSTLTANAELREALDAAFRTAQIASVTTTQDKTAKGTMWAAWRTVAALAHASNVDPVTLSAGIVGISSQYSEAAQKTAQVYASTASSLVEVYRAGLEKFAKAVTRKGDDAAPLTADNVTRSEATKLIKALRISERVTARDRAKEAVAAITHACNALLKPAEGADKEQTAVDALAWLEPILKELDPVALAGLPAITDEAEADDEDEEEGEVAQAANG